jgi:DNA polymerase-4
LRVGRRLRQAGLKARVVQLKLKLGGRPPQSGARPATGPWTGFAVLTRRTTLPSPTDDGQLLYRTALALLEREGLPGPVRLTGVAAHEFQGGETQLGLFAQGPSRGDKLNAALDRIARKYGAGAVLPADVRGSVAPDDEEQRAIGASTLDRPRD